MSSTYPALTHSIFLTVDIAIFIRDQTWRLCFSSFPALLPVYLLQWQEGCVPYYLQSCHVLKWNWHFHWPVRWEKRPKSYLCTPKNGCCEAQKHRCWNHNIPASIIESTHYKIMILESCINLYILLLSLLSLDLTQICRLEWCLLCYSSTCITQTNLMDVLGDFSIHNRCTSNFLLAFHCKKSSKRCNLQHYIRECQIESADNNCRRTRRGKDLQR